MFCLFLRIGPIIVLEALLVSTSILTFFLDCFSLCYRYAFIHMALQLFLVQVILSLRMIKKSKKLRQIYVSRLVFGSKAKCILKTLWNSMNVLGVISLFLYWMIKQGIQVTSTKDDDSKCAYTLYPLCIFQQITDHAQSVDDYQRMIDFLYSCTVFINLFLISLAVRQFYLYVQGITKNRHKLIQNSQINIGHSYSQSLLDCQILNSSAFYQSSSLGNNTMPILGNDDTVYPQCGICLRKLNGQRVIKLKCAHHFHSECLNLWLKVKDSCPYRCE